MLCVTLSSSLQTPPDHPDKVRYMGGSITSPPEKRWSKESMLGTSWSMGRTRDTCMGWLSPPCIQQLRVAEYLCWTSTHRYVYTCTVTFSDHNYLGIVLRGGTTLHYLVDAIQVHVCRVYVPCSFSRDVPCLDMVHVHTCLCNACTLYM